MARFLILQEYIPRYREQFFRRLGGRLESEGHELGVGTGGVGDSTKARRDAVTASRYEVGVHAVNLEAFGRKVVLRSTGRVLKNADYVVLEHARRNLDAYRLLLPRVLRKRPIGLWGHGREYVRKASWFEQKLFNALARRADWYFVYTEGGRQYLVDKLEINPDRITLVQNSLDSEALRSYCDGVTDDELSNFRAALGAKGPIVLHVGALDPSKRLDFLVEGMQKAREVIPDVELVIVGDGVLRQQVERASVRYPWVKWTGPVSDKEKAVALASADVMAIPGRVGLVIIDSFAASVPIVTVKHDLQAPEFEYLRNGYNGLVAENTVDSFADSLITVLTDTDLRAQLRDGCDASYEKYSLRTMVENYMCGLLNWDSATRRDKDCSD